MSFDEVRAEAFGEIGILPEDFYRMYFTDYLLLKKGFFNKRDYEQNMMRACLIRIVSPWIKNAPNPFQFFPCIGDAARKTNGITVSPENMKVLQQFKDKERDQKAKEN
jgi:hemoglobin-like flavoprotein